MYIGAGGGGGDMFTKYNEYFMNAASAINNLHYSKAISDVTYCY